MRSVPRITSNGLKYVATGSDIKKSPSYIQYHLDNKEALRRLNNTDDATFFDTANPITTDYDIWAAIRDATSSTPGSDEYQNG